MTQGPPPQDPGPTPPMPRVVAPIELPDGVFTAPPAASVKAGPAPMPVHRVAAAAPPATPKHRQRTARLDGTDLGLSVVTGLVCALVGAVLFGLLTNWLHTVFIYAVLGIGVLAGLGVRWAAQDSNHWIFGVLGGLFGIVGAFAGYIVALQLLASGLHVEGISVSDLVQLFFDVAGVFEYVMILGAGAVGAGVAGIGTRGGRIT